MGSEVLKSYLNSQTEKKLAKYPQEIQEIIQNQANMVLEVLDYKNKLPKYIIKLLRENILEESVRKNIAFVLDQKYPQILRTNAVYRDTSEIMSYINIIEEYKEKGIILKGDALGSALICGTAEDLKKKFKLVLEYKNKGIVLEGQALGSALQCGTAEELRQKLEIVLEHQKKGVILKGQALGLALQCGKVEELRQKFEVVLEHQKEGVILKGDALKSILKCNTRKKIEQ